MADSLPAWKVTGVAPVTDFVPGQGPIEGHNVTVVTNSSMTFTVFVPTTNLSDTDAVRAAIEERLTALHNIKNLTS